MKNYLFFLIIQKNLSLSVLVVESINKQCERKKINFLKFDSYFLLKKNDNYSHFEVSLFCVVGDIYWEMSIHPLPIVVICWLDLYWRFYIFHSTPLHNKNWLQKDYNYIIFLKKKTFKLWKTCVNFVLEKLFQKLHLFVKDS